jgi:hypothetical protein
VTKSPINNKDQIVGRNENAMIQVLVETNSVSVYGILTSSAQVPKNPIKNKDQIVGRNENEMI